MRSLSFPALALLLAAAFAPHPSLAQTHDFSGEYVMEGRGDAADDSDYSGTCTFTLQDKGYDVSCLNTDTKHTYVGKGLALGNGLAIVIGDRLVGDHGQVFEGEYLVVYERNDDGQLIGRWVDAQSSQQGSETLTPKK